MKQTKRVEISVGICRRNGKILLQKRNDTNPMWNGKWEFPGGKIDGGETKEEALVREVKEECGLDVESYAYLGEHEHTWNMPDSNLTVLLHVFACEMMKGEVVMEESEVSEIAWLLPDDALKYDSLQANDDILKKMYMPFYESSNMG